MITLTTDFGTRDWYVGAMKGAALAVNPEASIVDVTHDVPPQDVAHAAFVLANAYSTFASDTVHVVVVDPGVGTSRRPIVVVTPNGRFIGPDNGLLTYILAELDGWTVTGSDESFMSPKSTSLPAGCSAYELNRPNYWRRPVSSTFHGRDVFAPSAAHLDLSVPLEDMGDPVEDIVVLNALTASRDGEEIRGRVVFVDYYGNLISNIRASMLPSENVEIEIGGRTVAGLHRTFAEGDGLIALVGSHGFLEVAETNGNAAQRLSAGIGAKFAVRSGN